VVAKYFGDHNFNVVKNPKVHVEVDDARHFLNTTKEKFDAITSDPFDPWVKGAADAVHEGVLGAGEESPQAGGIVTVFVQLYDSGMAAVKSEIATFYEAFPDGIVWGNTVRRRGLRHRVARSGRAAPEDQRRRDGAAAGEPRVRRGGAIAAPDRIRFGDRAAVDLRSDAAPSWAPG
jgi:spermidine synthase